MLEENTKHDYTAAKFFGDFVYVLENDKSLTKFNLEQIRKSIVQSLKANAFDPAVDIVIVAGVAPYLALLGMALAELYPNQKLNLLVWDSLHHTYMLKQV